jgi:tetratricopeptide (TPR) repeat protein
MATKKNASAPSAPVTDASHDAFVAQYENALRLMQDRQYTQAKEAFEALLPDAPRHIADRARVHRQACQSKMNQDPQTPRNPVEIYDYAVLLMNQGRHDDAREQLQKLLRTDPDADYAHYGLAVLLASGNKVEEALRHLERAIELNPQNRLQARNDGDFQAVSDDPRFTELLYPETLGDTASPSWRS